MSKFLVNLFKCVKCTAPNYRPIVKRPFCVYYDFDTKCAEPNCNLKNRSVTSTRKLSGNEIISVMETALGLKAAASNTTRLLQETKINFLIEGSCIINLLSAMKGGADMGATFVTVYSNSLCTTKQTKHDLIQLGRFISEMYSIICISSSMQSVVDAIAEGSTVPVINVGSCFYSPIDAFAFVLTIYETFKKLNGLTVGIIASPNPYVNSLLCTLPRIGVNVRIMCVHNNQAVSARFLDLAQKYTKQNATTVKTFDSIAEVVENADCIVLACEEPMNTQLTAKDFDKASKDWKIACKLPAQHPVESSILNNDEKNISYNIYRNTHVLYSALFLRLLGIDFTHGIKIK